MNARLLLVPLALAALVLAGCGGGGGSSKPAAGDVATVAGLHITKESLQDQLNLARTSLKSQGQTFPKAGSTAYEALKAQALGLLVQEAAREQAAEKLGVKVTDQQVDTQLAELKKTYKLTEAKYKQQLAKQGLTDALVRAQIRTTLVSQQVAEKLTNDLTVDPADVAAYYQAHKSEYKQTEREVLEILVGKNKEALAKKLRAQIAAGADFGKLAKKYSQDPGSKNIGGKFTAVQGRDVANFDKVAFALETGELSQPVNTPEYGWFIIKATSPVRTVTQPQKDVADSIQQTLLQDKKNQAMTDWMTKVAENVCSGGKIEYQVGYTPNPDPCAQYTLATATTTTG